MVLYIIEVICILAAGAAGAFLFSKVLWEPRLKHIWPKRHEIKLVKFEDISTAQTDCSKLSQYLERNVHEDTVVIVASCPGPKMAEAEASIMQFKRSHKALRSNVQLGYCQKEGANNFLGK